MIRRKPLTQHVCVNEIGGVNFVKCEPSVNPKTLEDASFGDSFLARWRYLRYFLVPGPRVSQNGFLGCVNCEPAFWLWGQVHATYVRPKKACFRLRESRGGKPGAGFT